MLCEATLRRDLVSGLIRLVLVGDAIVDAGLAFVWVDERGTTQRVFVWRR